MQRPDRAEPDPNQESEIELEPENIEVRSPRPPSSDRSSERSEDRTDDRQILDFIIAKQRQKGAELSNPQAYARKCLQSNPDYWRSRYAESKRPSQPVQPYVDPWRIENSITLAIRMNDLAFANGKLENLRQRGEIAIVGRLLAKFGGALCP